MRTYLSREIKGFTLIETFIAVTLLTVAIVAPMLLTVQSLASAYYARDQITAFYLAQDGLEEVHQIRDGQVLQIAESSDPSGIDLFGPIPINQDFVIDARVSNPATAICRCGDPACPLKSDGSCPYLQTDGSLFGYNISGGTNTNFTRTMRATTVTSVGGVPQEIRITATVSWQTASYLKRTFSMSEDLYRWVEDGAAAN